MDEVLTAQGCHDVCQQLEMDSSQDRSRHHTIISWRRIMMISHNSAFLQYLFFFMFFVVLLVTLFVTFTDILAYHFWQCFFKHLKKICDFFVTFQSIFGAILQCYCIRATFGTKHFFSPPRLMVPTGRLDCRVLIGRQRILALTKLQNTNVNVRKYIPLSLPKRNQGNNWPGSFLSCPNLRYH